MKLVGGVRYDNFAADITNSITGQHAGSTPGPDRDYTSVRGGVIWQPTDEQSYYASY